MVQIPQSSDPEVASLPRDRYDIVTKDALHQFPEDILRAVLGHGNFQFPGFEESELTRSEAVMQESSVYQHLVETAAEERYQQGIEQGARQMSIESTLLILTERFPDADVPAVQPLLEAIADLNRLRQLNLNASIARSFHAFREQLEA